MDTPNSKGHSGFREAYQACAEENRVASDRLPFYVEGIRGIQPPCPGMVEQYQKNIEASMNQFKQRIGHGA